MRRTPLIAGLLAVVWFVTDVPAQSPYQSSSEFSDYAKRLRENALLRVEPQVFVPTTSRTRFTKFPWRQNIVTTVFWIGEQPTKNNPTPNHMSSWDMEWVKNYGGYDDPNPKKRRNYIPVNFTPRQNPFYIALPYNDIMRKGNRIVHKPEAPRVIPWFNQVFERNGGTVLKGRWIAIRKGNRVAYAQWEDCGPFRTDHYQYVFGNERPAHNLNRGAGLDVSPAVRDYLGMSGMDVTDWRFVDVSEVPAGPWRQYGDNNCFVIAQREREERHADRQGGIRVRLNR